MERIELDIWEPVPDKPGRVRQIGMRTAQEVFEELRQRLESTGYLPDEDFSINYEWENGREIPKDADIFCTTDYGGSEGIWIDVYLKWYEENKPITKTFATGKTLGESESDLDRMFLISSAITKAFHSDSVHARYIQIGETESPKNAVMHLNEHEQRTLINSLIDSRNRLKEETQAVEQLLRRVTGSITEFINEVGDRPLKINDFDMAVLAIQDGNFSAFNDVYLKEPDKLGDLLELTAGRPGSVGTQMTAAILGNAQSIISNEAYLNACKNAIATGVTERVSMMSQLAEICIKDLDMSLYGKLINDAMMNSKSHIADAILKQCTSEQIKHADPYLLIQAVWNKNRLIYDLATKGIDGNSNAAELVRALVNNHDEYSFKVLLDSGLNIANDNYSALHACIVHNSERMGKELLDRGMDFNGYKEWCENNGVEKNDGEPFNALKAHWENEIRQQEDQPDEAEGEESGMTMGGM